MPEAKKLIPVTVFTGFLGSGKTTIILNLIKQLPKGYKLAMLKNEFGNAAVDSQLAKDSNLQVKEMINGCLCCVLVGKLGNALAELLALYHPDRIIIETSGSAYPAPIAWEIRKMGDRLKLDAIITVIDALNFQGYKDISYTAKLQAEVTDLILINKHELADPKKLDRLLDDVYDLNPSTPKVKTNKGEISTDLIFGIDTRLFEEEHHLDGGKIRDDLAQKRPGDIHHMENEVELIEVSTDKQFSKEQITAVLQQLPAWDFFRIKGLVSSAQGAFLINDVFGRFELTDLKDYQGKTKITFMGKNFAFFKPQVQQLLGVEDTEITLTLNHSE